MSRLSFFKKLSSLSNENFKIENYRSEFFKVFISHCKSRCTGKIKKEKFNTLFDDFFSSLFLGNNSNNVRKAITNLLPYLKKEESIEQFLSQLFFIYIRKYIDSHDGKDYNWREFAKVSEAVGDFIDWAVNIDFSHEGAKEEVVGDYFENSIINGLEKIRQENKKISVLNTYYGIPIQNDAVVIKTSENSVFIKTKQMQNSAAIIERGIYILREKELGYDIYASVKPISVNGHELLELGRFDKMDSTIFLRQAMRVEPKNLAEVTVKHAKKRFKAKLVDISLGGVALSVPVRLRLTTFSTYFIYLEEEISPNEPIEIEASLIYTSKFKNGFKLHFQINVKKREEALLALYIAKREQNIIGRLKESLI